MQIIKFSTDPIRSHTAGKYTEEVLHKERGASDVSNIRLRLKLNCETKTALLGLTKSALMGQIRYAGDREKL